MASDLLRGLDSNERPPGYEPGELPTAPPRDVYQSVQCFSQLRCKGKDFNLHVQIFKTLFSYFFKKNSITAIKRPIRVLSLETLSDFSVLHY